MVFVPFLVPAIPDRLSAAVVVLKKYLIRWCDTALR